MDLNLHASCASRSPGCRRWNHFNVLREPGHVPGSFFGTLSSVRSIKANPLKNGDAKPWILSYCGHEVYRRFIRYVFFRNKTARLPKAIQMFAGQVWAPLSKLRNQWRSKIKLFELLWMQAFSFSFSFPLFLILTRPLRWRMASPLSLLSQTFQKLSKTVT